MNMERTKLQIKMLSCCFFVGGLLLAGCSTDDSIDVGEVDTLLGVGTDGFSIPAGGSEPISIINLFKIDDSDCIDTIPGGDYQFFKKGDDIDATNVKIDPVSISLDNNNINEIEFIIPIVSQYISNNSRGTRNVKRIAGEPISFKQSITTFDFSQSNLTGAIRKILKAEVDPIPFSLKETFSDGLKDILTEFQDMELELPAFFEIENNKILIRNGASWIERPIVDGKISLNGIKTAYPLELKGNIVSVDFNKPEQSSSDGKKQVLKFKPSNDYKKDLAEVIINGFVHINVTYDEDKLTFDPSVISDVIAKLSGKTDADFKINSAFTIGKPGNPKMELRDVEGRFYPNIDLNIDPIDIKDIPDFLTKDGVEIDLEDILLTLDVKSTLPIAGKVDAKLTPYVNGVVKEPIMVNNIKINSNAESKVLISRKDNTSKAGYTDYHWSADPDGSGDVGNLLTNIPNKIEFHCEAVADSNVVSTIYLNREYSIKPSYDIKAPLALKGKSCIVYDDSTNDWNKDLKDNDIDLDGETYLMIEGEVVNNTPLDLSFNAPTPLGVGGSIISTVKVQIVDGNGNEIPSLEIISQQTNKLRLKLSTTGNGLKELDGVSYAVKAKAAASGAVTTLNGRTHTIQIKDIVGTLKGKIVIDPDKKD